MGQKQLPNALDAAAPESWLRFRAQHLLGTSLAGLNQFAEAETLLLSGYQGMMRLASTIPAADRIQPAKAAAPIATLYRKLGRPQDAAKWQDAEHLPAASGSGR